MQPEPERPDTGGRLGAPVHKWGATKAAEPGASEHFKYGEVLFEETGTKVPYIIVPDTPEGKDPKAILQKLTTYAQPRGAPLSKPNVMYQVRSNGDSYLQYAEEVFGNETLATAWGWRKGDADILFHEEAVTKLARTRSNRKMAAQQTVPSVARTSRTCVMPNPCDSVEPAAQQTPKAATSQEAVSIEQLSKQEKRTFDSWKEETFGSGSAFEKRKETPSGDGAVGYGEYDGAVESIPIDEAIREYGESMLQCFADVTKSVVTSDGWYIGPAGRKAVHQLIGDTIDKYGEMGAGHKQVEDVTWIQYASLQNKDLGGPDNHADLVKTFRDNAVEIKQHDTRDEVQSKLKGNAIYPSEEQHFPSVKSIQGHLKDKDGNTISTRDYINEMVANLPPGVQIHPHTTALILFDQPSDKRGTEQALPWGVVDDIHEALRDQGILEGLLLVHGEASDLKSAADYLASSMPVITFKSTGGTSDYLARQFESRQTDPNILRDLALSWRGGLTMGRPYPQTAMTFTEPFTLKLPRDANDAEMMVVNVLNPNVGEKISRQMAEMLTMIDDTDSQLMDFAKQERNRIDDAWDRAFIYRSNAAREKRQANLFNYLMMLINLVLVIFVVYKTVTFPDLMTCTVEPATEAGGPSVSTETIPVSTSSLALAVKKASGHKKEVLLDEKHLFFTLSTIVVVLPILSGLLMTFNNAFSPLSKSKMLSWGSDHTESEIYQYRARAGKYSVLNTSNAWSLSDDEGKINSSKKTSVSKQFVHAVTAVGDTVRANSHIQSSSLRRASTRHTDKMRSTSLCGKTREDLREESLKKLKGGEIIVDESDDPDMEDPKYRLLETKDISDDGYSMLSAEEYLAVRTKGKLADLQLQLPGLARKKKLLQYLTYLATVTSILLGTLHYDLYIAISTAFMGMCTSILEYTKVESRINTLNTAEKNLDDLIFWWTSLNFVERRMAKHKDYLVKKTEDAVCAEADMLVSDMVAKETNGDKADKEECGEAGDSEDAGKQDGEEKKDS